MSSQEEKDLVLGVLLIQEDFVSFDLIDEETSLGAQATGETLKELKTEGLVETYERFPEVLYGLTDKGRIQTALIGGQQLNFDELRKKTGIPPSNLLSAVSAMEMGEELIYNTNTLKYSIRN